MADSLGITGIGSGEQFGAEHLRLSAPATGCALPPRIVAHAAQVGLWQLRNTRVVWRFNCKEIPVNAMSVTVTDGSRWNSPTTLSGDVILSQLREYDETLWDETTRPGTIRDMPKKIELEFPALPSAFYHMVRRLRTFAVGVTVEIALFDALDPEPLLTNDFRTYYAANGQWKPGSLRLYVNGAPVIEGFTYDAAYGYITFPTRLLPTDEVLATYVWAPLCFLTGEVTPIFKARAVPLSDREIGVRLTMIESRGPAHGVYQAPLQSLVPGGLPSGGAFGAVNLLQEVSVSDVGGTEWLFQTDALMGFSDGQGIDSFPDGSGNANDAAQATSGRRWTYKTNIRNGLPVARAAADQFMQITGYSRVRTDATFHYVVNYDPTQSGDAPLLATESTHGGFQNLASAKGGNKFGWFASNNGYDLAGFPSATSGWQVLSVAYDFSNSEVRLYRNGALLYSHALILQADNDTVWKLGSYGAGSDSFVGDYGEQRMYPGIQTSGDFDQTILFLKTKWAIP